MVVVILKSLLARTDHATAALVTLTGPSMAGLDNALAMTAMLVAIAVAITDRLMVAMTGSMEDEAVEEGIGAIGEDRLDP